MSWLKGLQGNEPDRYVEPEDTPKVADPAIANRNVSTKSANQPFLAYKAYREEQEAIRNAWLERKKLRDEKIARGEEAGPEERDPTEAHEIGLVGILKFLLFVVLFAVLASKFITGSYTWDTDSKWAQLSTYWPESNQRLFSERFLSEFDGKHIGRPIYLAIDGLVYDVSQGKAYQPGGSYAILAGVDAARAFGTGCFKVHRTHDLRGLTERELAGVEHWKKYYAEHKVYKKVGRVTHHPINPASPIPEPCDPKTGQSIKRENSDTTETDSQDAHDHDEL